MPALTTLFFRSPYQPLPENAWQVVQWWELRRPIYNMVVGAAGLVTLTVAATVFGAREIISSAFPVIVIYGIASNIFYTFGSLVDILITWKWGDRYTAIGAALFRYGFAFSVGLTLIPIPVLIAFASLPLLSAS